MKRAIQFYAEFDQGVDTVTVAIVTAASEPAVLGEWTMPDNDWVGFQRMFEQAPMPEDYCHCAHCRERGFCFGCTSGICP